MDLISSSQLSEEKKMRKSSLSTPVKPLGPIVMLSSVMPSPSGQIVTPEKPIELPTWTRSRNVAFSAKEVKKIAAGLQCSNRVPADLGGLGGLDEGVLTTEPITLGSDRDDVLQLSAKSHVELPEKYEMLLEFFNSMVSSIRLLHLRGDMPSFSKISPQVESLTNRRFCCGHLAQLKYLLPEAICVKKVLVHDETTSCMKPELQITLQIDVFGPRKDQKKGSGYPILNKIFRHRLLEFFKEHPEGDDVPEVDLPEMFNQTKPPTLQRKTTDLISMSSSLNVEASPVNPSQQQATAPSHMPRSFQRRFSQKVLVTGAETKESSDEKPLLSNVTSPLKYTSTHAISKGSCLSSSQSHLLSVNSLVTKKEVTEKPMSGDGSPTEVVSVGTPAKDISTPARLMCITPQLQTPKRSRPDTDEEFIPVKTIRRPTRTKLFPTPVKNAKYENEEADVAVDDVLQFLPKSLLQSVMEKERKALDDQEAGVADAERRQRMLACLPKLFDMILLIFQSLKHSVITKQELIHKIIVSHCDIVDKSEVEEQLSILQELVPDWISGKMASSGDLLFCVNNISSPEDLRRRISEAR